MTQYELTPEGVRRKGKSGGKVEPPGVAVPPVVVRPPCAGGHHIYTVEYGAGRFHFCPRFRVSALQGRVDVVIAPEAVLSPRDWGVPTVRTIDWCDQDVPQAAPRCFWEALLDEVASGRSLAFCCMGGHGRTGTALAIVLALVDGLSAGQAVERARTVYCPAAVESLSQEAYIREVVEGVVCAAPPIRYFDPVWDGSGRW